MRMVAVRDRNLSLWQSAVGEVAAKFAASSPVPMAAMCSAASLHAEATAKGAELPLPDGDAAAIAEKLDSADPEALAYVSKLVFDVARAHQSGDVRRELEMAARLSDFVTRHYARRQSGVSERGTESDVQAVL